MIKNLVKHGNSCALVIEKPILELLGATTDSSFEIVTDGTSLILTPVRTTETTAKITRAIDKIGRRYSKTFSELAK